MHLETFVTVQFDFDFDFHPPIAFLVHLLSLIIDNVDRRCKTARRDRLDFRKKQRESQIFTLLAGFYSLYDYAFPHAPLYKNQVDSIDNTR
jgi:hypothetical protein